MNRRVLAIVALAALVFLSGCSILGGGGEIDEDDLLGDQEYDWNTTANATYDLSVSSDSFAAVVAAQNRSSIAVSQSTAFRGDQSVSVADLKFQFVNGTVVNATHPGLTAEKGSDETEIQLPARNGTVAWVESRSGKQWSVPVVAEGSHEVRLSNSSRVGIPLLSRTSPDPDESSVENDQMTLYYDDIDGGSIAVRYYLVRDLYLFGGIGAVALLVGGGGAIYYLRGVRAAQTKREEVGLDVETDDDPGDDGPPPGMR
ncbi:hypothetical protein SAMN05216226_1177 [Halovenus aranensis]|jgi:hypothetical protein|uniref:Lipoprotein n=1 Tax=Halovenus aranensis TaxID=890420 RepID=A0A1G8YYZ5_9EURY|nr:DUF5803 family protein [Halovenus aranensis]SDK08006.1 hypothetical protein SAMN05216226_1177 [Halovenus aranensis]